MRFYYTGASSNGAEQKKSSLSLGGEISSSPVPNDVFSNLFGEISSRTISDNKSEYIMLALKNETGNSISNIDIYYDYDADNFAKLEISAVSPLINGCGEQYFEKIPNKYSKPLTSSFVEANGAGNSVSIGSLLPNQHIGIWFKRTLTDIGSGSIPKDENSINSCDNVYQRYLNKEELAKEEKIVFNISY